MPNNENYTQLFVNDVKSVLPLKGSGSDGGYDIIDVTELPTDNIDTEKYYRIDDKLYKYDDGTADTNDVLGTWTFDLSLLEQKLSEYSDDPNYFIGDCTIECADGNFFGILVNGSAISYFQDSDQTAPTEPWAFIDGDKIYVERATQQTITITSGSDETLAFLQETATKEAGTPHWDCYYIPAEYVTALPTTDIDPDKYYWMDNKIYKWEGAGEIAGTWEFDDEKLVQYNGLFNANIQNLQCNYICPAWDPNFLFTRFVVGGYGGKYGVLEFYPEAGPVLEVLPDGGFPWLDYPVHNRITVLSGSPEALEFLKATATKTGTIEPSWKCYYIPKLEAWTVTPRATDCTITPNYGYDGFTKVTIKGDSNLIPANIKKDVTIFGVKGTNAPTLQEKTVTVNGEATPDEGYDALSKVIVDVPSITEIATASEMTALLTEENINRLYRFTGTTDETYINGDLYEVMSK